MLKLQGWNYKESCFGTVPKPIVTDFRALTTGAAIQNYLTQNFGNVYNPTKSNIGKANLATNAHGVSLWYGNSSWPYTPVITFTFRYHIPKLVTLKIYTPAIGNTTHNSFFSIYARINRASGSATNTILITANKSGTKVTACNNYNHMYSKCSTPTTGHDGTYQCLSTWNAAGIKTLWCYFVNPYGGFFGKNWGCTEQDLKDGTVTSIDVVFSSPRSYIADPNGTYPAGNYTARTYLNSIEFAYDI